MRVLGIDPSLTASGWCLYDSAQSGTRTCECWGEIESDSKLPEPVRYRSIQVALHNLILEVKPDYVAIETPIFKASYSEGMYALFVCMQQVLYELRQNVVFLSVTLAKGFVRERSPDLPEGWKIEKREMMSFVENTLGIKKLRKKDNNRADAYVLAYMGARFWALQRGDISESELNPYEAKSFTRIHEYSRGKKAGLIEKTGIIHREGERFFQWSQVKHGNEEIARVINESPEGSRLPKVKEDRKSRRVSRHKPAEGVPSPHSDGLIDLGLLDRWSTE